MDIIYDILVIFIITSFIAWILEAIYKRYFSDISTGKWSNPGFGDGPYIPLYGFSAIFIYLISIMSDLHHFIEISLIIIFVISIELFTGLFFLKFYNIKLWDYSINKFNYKGLICFKMSFYFTIMCIIYYYLLNDIIVDIISKFRGNMIILFILGYIYGIFTIDFMINHNILHKFKSTLSELKKRGVKARDHVYDYINLRYELQKDLTKEKRKQLNKFIKNNIKKKFFKNNKLIKKF